MRNTIYRQLVFCIDTYRTWIEVADDSLYKEHVIKRRTVPTTSVSRTLVLRALQGPRPIRQGHDVDGSRTRTGQSFATYRKQDASFKTRIKKGDSYLSARDAEAIIRLATYGIIRLELVVRPLNILSNSYYL